jgi:hypothetical protein
MLEQFVYRKEVAQEMLLSVLADWVWEKIALLYQLLEKILKRVISYSTL